MYVNHHSIVTYQSARMHAITISAQVVFRKSATRAASSFKVLLMGTDHVSLPTLEQLHLSSKREGQFPGLVSSVDVLCPGDRPAGRGQHSTAVPVKAYAARHGLRTVEVPYGVRDLRTWDPSPVFAGLNQPYDLAVVVSFGYFLPPTLLDPLRLGALNLHPSLLPKYRGAAPIPRAILAGETETGISIIDIHRAKFDAGRIFAQETVSIGPTEGCGALTTRLAARGAQMMMEVIASYEAANAAARPQPIDGGTKAPKIKADEGAIRWDDPAACTAGHISRMVRAFDDSVGTYSYLRHGYASTAGVDNNAAVSGPLKRIKLLEVAALDGAGPDTHLTGGPVTPPTVATGQTGDSRQGQPQAAGAVANSNAHGPGSLWWDSHGKNLLLRTGDVGPSESAAGKDGRGPKDNANMPGQGWLKLLRVQPETKKVMPAVDWVNGLKIRGTGWLPVRMVMGSTPSRSAGQ